MELSLKARQAKLTALAEAEGFATVLDMLEAATFDSVSPAICTTQGCSYTCDMEPDQDRGWCEACGRNTMQSALLLAGVI